MSWLPIILAAKQPSVIEHHVTQWNVDDVITVLMTFVSFLFGKLLYLSRIRTRIKCKIQTRSYNKWADHMFINEIQDFIEILFYLQLLQTDCVNK